MKVLDLHDTFEAACEVAKAKILASGLTLSKGSWAKPTQGDACFFSVESFGPATFGAPKKCVTVHLEEKSGKFSAGDKNA